MSGVGTPGRRSFDPAAGLRALAELINDAIAQLDTHAALAAAGPRPIGPVRVHMAVSPSSVSPASTHAPQGASPTGSGEEAGTQDAAQAEDAQAEGIQAEDVEEEHAEVWRLVALAQQGDGEAFGQLYDRYVDSVYRFVYYRVNDRALAEDFTSETFLRALRRIGTITYQGRDIGAWLVTIARNIVLDHVKSARNRLEVTTADSPEPGNHVDSPESAVLTTLTNERLMAAVGQLNDEQRECVLLRFIQGFSVSETAHVMGKNDGAIKALQHRAIRKLGELVGGELL
jgi:RNA polymerase sigma-70 factor (ECF subfamily)